MRLGSHSSLLGCFLGAGSALLDGFWSIGFCLIVSNVRFAGSLMLDILMIFISLYSIVCLFVLLMSVYYSRPRLKSPRSPPFFTERDHGGRGNFSLSD